MNCGKLYAKNKSEKRDLTGDIGADTAILT